jgi:DNA (cytosine-5)-methyltransferase 1
MKAISLFTGIMGLDLGLEAYGIKIILGCEKDGVCQRTIKANRPGIPILGDVLEYSASQLREISGLPSKGGLDVVIGGPPCQDFSTAGGMAGIGGMEGNLTLKFVRLVADLSPEYFVMENVRGLLSSERGGKKGGALQFILHLLGEAGYSVAFNLYDSANYGTPQRRERVIILGKRFGDPLPFLNPTHSEEGTFGLPKWRTFRQASKGIPRHDNLVLRESQIKYLKMLGPGQCWRDLPPKVQVEAMGDGNHLQDWRECRFSEEDSLGLSLSHTSSLPNPKVNLPSPSRGG